MEWFPYLKIKITKFQFNVFDRYEIHIQDFIDFVYALFYDCPILIFVNYNKNDVPSQQKRNTQKIQRCARLSEIVNKKQNEFVGSQIYKHNMFPGRPHIFLYC